MPGVDVISVGALTHSAPAADLSLTVCRGIDMETIRTDCLVIGAGLAGCAYALQAAQARPEGRAAVAGRPARGQQRLGAGRHHLRGVAPIRRSCARDILEASDGTANPAAIDQLVREGPAAVRELLIDELHVAFDRDAGGGARFHARGRAQRTADHPCQGHDRPCHPCRGGARASTPRRGITRRAGLGRGRPAHAFAQHRQRRRPVRAAHLLRRLCARLGEPARCTAVVAKKTVLADRRARAESSCTPPTSRAAWATAWRWPTGWARG